jgi:hypothetical protein
MKAIASIEEPGVIKKILKHLGAESGASVGKAIYLSHLSYASFLMFSILVLKCRTYKVFNFVLLDA